MYSNQKQLYEGFQQTHYEVTYLMVSWTVNQEDQLGYHNHKMGSRRFKQPDRVEEVQSHQI